MPRPTSKTQLLEAMQREHAAVETLLATITPEQMITTNEATCWAIKDVLAHLAEWEQMCLGWYRAGLRGETPALPAPGFNWGQLPALNQQIYEKHCDRPLSEILAEFRLSYRRMLETVQGMDEADLFTPGRFAWTKKNLLGAYFVSATSSHYDWAKKEIKKCLKGG